MTIFVGFQNDFAAVIGETFEELAAQQEAFNFTEIREVDKAIMLNGRILINDEVPEGMEQGYWNKDKRAEEL